MALLRANHSRLTASRSATPSFKNATARTGGIGAAPRSSARPSTCNQAHICTKTRSTDLHTKHYESCALVHGALARSGTNHPDVACRIAHEEHGGRCLGSADGSGRQRRNRSALQSHGKIEYHGTSSSLTDGYALNASATVHSRALTHAIECQLRFKCDGEWDANQRFVEDMVHRVGEAGNAARFVEHNRVANLRASQPVSYISSLVGQLVRPCSADSGSITQWSALGTSTSCGGVPSVQRRMPKGELVG